MRPFAILLVLSLAGCTSARIFQQKVPEPVLKAPAQIEHERAAADLIAQKIETPVELKPVAQSLSASLGVPKTSLVDVKAFSLPTAARQSSSDLNTSIVDLQKRLDQTNARLATLQGKDIEGTGISLFGPSVGFLVIALIALGIVFPPAFTILFLIFRRLRATTAKIVETIDSHDNGSPLSNVKADLKEVMDVAEKRVIHQFQKP